MLLKLALMGLLFVPAPATPQPLDSGPCIDIITHENDGICVWEQHSLTCMGEDGTVGHFFWEVPVYCSRPIDN